MLLGQSIPCAYSGVVHPRLTCKSGEARVKSVINGAGVLVLVGGSRAVGERRGADGVYVRYVVVRELSGASNRARRIRSGRRKGRRRTGDSNRYSRWLNVLWSRDTIK